LLVADCLKNSDDLAPIALLVPEGVSVCSRCTICTGGEIEVSKFTSFLFGLHTIWMSAFLHLSPEYTSTVFPLPSFVFNLAYSNEYLKLACRNSQEGCVHAMEWQGAGIHATNLLKKLHASAKEPLAAASCSPH
jgi:hypothetical protein